eukprot:7333303-Alexandrium_andersonii.AAC.1
MPRLRRGRGRGRRSRSPEPERGGHGEEEAAPERGRGGAARRGRGRLPSSRERVRRLNEEYRPGICCWCDARVPGIERTVSHMCRSCDAVGEL